MDTKAAHQMSDATRKMIREWIRKDGGDHERTARWMARTLRICGIREAREFIKQATN